jgi:hypothetical protein
MTFGGRFPTEMYDELVQAVGRIFNQIILTAYASAKRHDDNFEGVVRVFNVVADEATNCGMDPSSILSLLSASLASGYAFPAYVRVDVTQVIWDGSITPERLDNPALPALAVVQVSGALFRKELSHAMGYVKDLVGEL